MSESKQGAKGRKLGRNAKCCERYRLEGRREKNKRKKLIRHCKRFENDKQAAKALELA